jgi:hypothetical protein
MSSHPLHALSEPNPPAWSAINATSSGAFLRDVTLVPFSAPVLRFAPDGTVEGHQSQADADWVAAELDKMPNAAWTLTDVLGPVGDVTSGACLTRWDEWRCTRSEGHPAEHRAHDTAGTALASRAGEVTTELKPAVKRPVRARKTVT